MRRAMFLAVAMIGTGFTGTASAAPATFPADPASLGAIPDGFVSCDTTPGSREVKFNVSGLSGELNTVAVGFTFAPIHPWVGDLLVSLFGPSGGPQDVFLRPGSVFGSPAGDSSDAAGPYTFSDSAPAVPTFPDAAADASSIVPVPSGSYRPTTITGNSGSFAPLVSSNRTSYSGVWTLRFYDLCLGSTGSVAAASLYLDAGPPALVPSPAAQATKRKCKKKRRASGKSATFAKKRCKKKK